MNILGSGLGTIIRVGSLIGGVLIILWGLWETSSFAKGIPFFLLGLFVIGAGQALANQLRYQQSSIIPGNSLNSIFSIPWKRRNYGQRKRRNDGQNQLVMHGVLWVIFWMAVGAAISLTLYPMFPEISKEWVQTWQSWAQELKN